ncbi:MAG: phosphatidate cytidylyltransferase [Cellvibrionaceae bacterium]|jgi:phosphatidate cytidylyltransferase
MFWQRFFVVILGVPTCYFVIYNGGWLFSLVLLILLTIGCYEYARMAFGGESYAQMGLLIATVWIVLFAEYFKLSPGYEFYVYISLFLLLAYSLWGYEKRNLTFPENHLMKMILGFMIIGWMGRYLFVVRDLDLNGSAFLLIMFAIWAADVGAYVFGSLIGRTKMAPNTSPGKSIEGYLSGIAFSCVMTPLFGILLFPVYSTMHVVIIALILSIGVPLGDLGMSMLKRQAGVKDYGGIIPGHGGVMDRLDTILWGVVPGYYLIVLIAQGVLVN